MRALCFMAIHPARGVKTRPHTEITRAASNPSYGGHLIQGDIRNFSKMTLRESRT